MSKSGRLGAARAGWSRWGALAVSATLLASVTALLAPPAPASAAPAAGQFVPVAPATVVNNVSLAAGGSTTVTVTGSNGIPAPDGVAAVALNVIANQPSATGWLQAHPAGPRPAGNSTLDYQAGRTTADFEVVPVSANGQITIYSASATKVLVRLRGWYAKAERPGGADWAQYRNGPAHLGGNPAETVLTPTTVRGVGQAWTVNLGGAVAEPVVVDGVVYAGTADGRLHALDAGTGATRWTAAIGGAVSSAAVVDGVVYAGASGGVYALDAATGATRWTASTGAVHGAPTVADGVVYAGTSAGVYALDASTGASRWTAVFGPQPDPNGGPVFCVNPSRPSAPAVAGGIMYVAGWCDGKVYAFDATSGSSVWTLSGRRGPSAPLVANGTVYVDSEAGLQALDAATGASVWTVSAGASTAPVLANGVLYHGTVSGVLVARNPASGATLWSDPFIGTSTNAYTAVVVANGAVYSGRRDALTAHHP